MSEEKYTELYELKDEIGQCESCRYSHCSSYDPSPAGVSLSSGSMEDWDCSAKLGEEVDGEPPCPLWNGDVHFCETHGFHYGENCQICEDNAQYEALKEIEDEKKGVVQ